MLNIGILVEMLREAEKEREGERERERRGGD